MKSRNIIYTIIATVCFSLGIMWSLLHKHAEKPEVYLKKECAPAKILSKEAKHNASNVTKDTSSDSSSKKAAHSSKIVPVPSSIKKTSKKITSKKSAPKKTASTSKNTSEKTTTKKIIIKNAGSNKLSLTKVTYEELPGWDKADVKKSLTAFQLSCKTFIKQKSSQSVGSKHINMKAGDWKPACQAALELDSISEETAKTFFEKWFHPVEFEQKKPDQGLFTGYYMPQIQGSLTRTGNYTTPIYGLPKQLSLNKFTREAIDDGALNKKAPVIAWIKSPIDRLFLEIEGSGVIKLANGKNLYLGYAGENGAPYTSIGSVLINKGIMTRDNASKPAIKRYLEEHPRIAGDILHKNKSFVFFESLKKPMALGARGMALTPGYSLAVDKQWIPLGAPLYLDTKKPDSQQDKEKHMQRLMIAQDTGGAIRGLIRGDIYWGSGKIAAFLGEHMKNKGHYWLLLPKQIFNKLAVQT